MTARSVVLEAATIWQQCKLLHLPTVAAQCAQLAERAVRERRTHLGYLEALPQTELEEREQRLVARRIREAHLPRMKTLEEFEFAQCPKVSAQQIHELAEGGYLGRAEPIIFILSATAGPAKPIGADRRTGRGQASVAARPRAWALGPLRPDRD